MRTKLANFLFGSWREMDRVMEGLTSDDRTRNLDGGSSFAWTFAHVAQGLDLWINVPFQRLAPNPFIYDRRFSTGADGTANDWPAIQAAVKDIRLAARAYLEQFNQRGLENEKIIYDGSAGELRESEISLQWAVMGQVAHHYYHIGEIATKRVSLGHDVGDYPGLLETCI